MAEIPAEIIAQILSLLPVITLLRFKCVCKSWYSLIKSPFFIKLHLNQTLFSDSDSGSDHLLLYGTSLYSSQLRHDKHLAFSELSLPFELTGGLNFLGSCNGVLCFANSALADIFLYNPLTRSLFNVPRIPIPRISNNVMLFGFGYDSTTDDYKVLRVVQGFDVDFSRGILVREQARVFSVNACSWKSVQGIGSPIFYNSKDLSGCLVNGVLHYIVHRNDTHMLDHSEMQLCIACFDLRTESFSFMDCSPWNDDSYSKIIELRELGGCLSVTKINRNECGVFSAELWVMKEYGNKESWVRLFTNHICGLEFHRCVMPIVYSKDRSKVMMQMDGTRFEWYDLELNDVERFTIHGVPNQPFRAGVFVGSLVSFPDNSNDKTLPMEHEEKNDLFVAAILGSVSKLMVV